MPEPSAKLWLLQVDSDMLAADRVWDESDERTYCQTVAKYQQAVEKSAKAVFAAIKDFGIVLPALGYDHDLSRLLSILVVLPKAAGASIQQQIDGLLTHYQRFEIVAISELAPKKPMPGGLHRINTEYPYEVAAGVWAAPAAAGTFSRQRIERSKAIAGYLYQGARKIVSALRL